MNRCRPERDTCECLANYGVGIHRQGAFRNLDIDEHSEVGHGRTDTHGQEGPAVDLCAILLRNAADQKADAVLKRETFPLELVEALLVQTESRVLEVAVRTGREIEDGDYSFPFGVFEPRKACARAHVRWRLETDPQAGGKDHLGRYDENGASKPGP